MEDLIQEITRSSNWWAYFILAVSAYIENVFPPIPGDTITLVGAYFVGTRKLTFMGVWISTTLGSSLGFFTLYFLAYALGWSFFEKHRFRWLKKERMEKANTWFQKYGYWVVLFNRFLSGVRSVISITAGLSRLSILWVAINALIGCAIWNGLLIYFGAFLGQNWQDISQYLKIYNWVILVIIALLIGGVLIYYFFFRKKK